MTQLVLNIKDESVLSTLKKVVKSKESAYETSQREKREGKVNTYASAEDFFAKMEA